MLRSGEEYLESLRDGREVWVGGERVRDITTHPLLAPIINARAAIYDQVLEEANGAAELSYVNPSSGEREFVLNKRPYTKEDWYAKWRALDQIFEHVGGIVARIGDENIGEMWSMLDGAEFLRETGQPFVDNIERHTRRIETLDLFHVSGNTDPKGDRSKAPQDQDPDMLLHAVRETDNGIVVRGAKFETAAAYSDQAFVKPTIANWGDSKMSDYAIGFISDMGAPGMKHICRTSFSENATPEDFPITARLDEIETLTIFDDVEIPWENVLLYQETKGATFVRGTVHRYAAFAMLMRLLRTADLLVGIALLNVQQTGLEKQQAVQEKLALLGIFRESLRAHAVGAIELAEESPGGFAMPQQSILYAGRYLGASQMPQMMHTARELCGGQICLTPNAASFAAPEIAPLLEKYYSVNDDWPAEARRKLLAFSRDVLNSGYGGHRLTFQLFSQAPPFAHLRHFYGAFDFDGPGDFVRKMAGVDVPVELEA